MTETVDTVFGNDATNTPRKIPDEIYAGLGLLKDDYKVDGAVAKQQYVTMLNDPKVQEQGEAKFLVALRALRSLYNGQFAQGSGRNVLWMPFNVNGKPLTDKKGGFAVRAFGLVKSVDTDFELVGPLDIRFSGLAAESAAASWAKSLVPGTVYKVRISLSSQSKTGKLAFNEAAFAFADAGRSPEATDAASDPWWRQSYQHLALDGYPNYTPVAELLTAAKPNVVYHIASEVVRGRTGVQATTNQPNGNLVLSDDSVTATLAKEHGGGLFAFLPTNLVSAANLPVGSRIDALVSGYQKPKKDNSGALTGEVNWSWSVIALDKLVDLTPGTVVPNPATPAVTINERPAPAKMLGF